MPLTSVGRSLLKASLTTRGAALTLVLVAWAVYHPALHRVFADDQIHYLAELGGRTSLLDGLHHYDYAATRRFWKGDDALFRPLLFTWLAVGNWLFAYHHVAWNVASLLLHVLVGVALFRLLIAIRPSPFALPTAVLFLVLKPPVELVMWNHLGGYLLACACFAIGGRAFVRLTRGDTGGLAGTATYACAFGAAGLLYEAMAVISVLGAGIILACDWRRSRRVSGRRAVILLVPALLFVTLYAFHARRVERLTYIDRPGAGDQLQAGDLLRSLSIEWTVAGHWASDLATPSSLRLSSTAFFRFVKARSFSWRKPLHLFNVLVVLAALLTLACATSRRQLARAAPLLIFLCGALIIYIAVLGSGRTAGEILGVTYYTYIFGLICTVAVYALVDFERVLSRRWLSVAASAVLAAAIALHSAGSAQTAREVERANHYPAMYFARVIGFVDLHKREPDFSFAILPHPETLDPVVDLVTGYPDDPKAVTERHRVTEIVFARYYNSARPKYLLEGSATRLAQPAGESAR